MSIRCCKCRQCQSKMSRQYKERKRICDLRRKVYVCAGTAAIMLAILVASILESHDNSELLTRSVQAQSWCLQHTFREAGMVGLFSSSVVLDASRLMQASSFFGKVVASAKGSTDSEICHAAMKWPVKPARIVKAFNPPPKPWLAGHRGVDLAASPGTPLFAPADGVISFAGHVAGKSVVSIRHGELTSTFEPAVTKFTVGVAVKQGQQFGHVEGGSDHCGKRCVQWGLKRKNRTYENPAGMTARRKIVLKPIDS